MLSDILCGREGGRGRRKGRQRREGVGDRGRDVFFGGGGGGGGGGEGWC